MNSREIIIRNIERSGPERIGLAFDHGRRNDFCSAGSHRSDEREKRWVEGPLEYHIDVWGNTWHRIVGMSRGGEVCKAAIEDWGQLGDYRMPDLANPKNFAEAKEVFARNGDFYRVASLPGFPFAICRYLRKMEIYFQDLILERRHIDELHDRVTGLLEDMMVQYAAAGADGVFFCEDWGTQQRLLVSPAMWREIFKPLFQRLCDTAHRHGLHVLMHSCGNVWDIIDDLADVGVNVLQFDQPALYGLERLADKLRQRGLCLYSGVDIQQVMPTGDRERIVSEARKMVPLFAAGDGGLIARNYGDLNGIGVQEEWDQWAYDEFLESSEITAA